MRQNKYEYDAFISHAVEDKIPIANELCAKLERAGLKIWYSGKELGIGDSIEKTIEKGLNRSRYGIVIFSPTYLAKNWTIREFYTLLAKEIEEHKVILPVLYNISLDELKNKDLLMADRFAVNADRGIDFVVERLVREIRKAKVVEPKMAWFSRIWLVLILSLLANIGFLIKGMVDNPAREVLQLHSSFGREGHLPNERPTLMGQMQGLLERANTCACDRARESRSAPANNAILINQRQNYPSVERVADLQNGRAKSVSRPNAGSKMTMAVVFQIETASPVQPGLEQEVEEILESISMGDNDGPFIAASHREDLTDNGHSGCSHSENSAD